MGLGIWGRGYEEGKIIQCVSQYLLIFFSVPFARSSPSSSPASLDTDIHLFRRWASAMEDLFQFNAEFEPTSTTIRRRCRLIRGGLGMHVRTSRWRALGVRRLLDE